MEYDYVINIEKEGKKKGRTDDYMAINLTAGFAFSPIFDEENIYFFIFQDARGNPAKNYNFLGGVELELKLDKIILTGGFIGRLPDADIFGLHPRWYFSVSN